MVAEKKTLSESEVRSGLASRLQSIGSSASSGAYGSLLTKAVSSYETKWKRKMPDSIKGVLLNSFDQMSRILQTRDRYSKEAIQSAIAADVSKVDNPITLAYNLMSILIPNFAYTELLGVQALPTKVSPIFYPQISANESRNNVQKGDKLLGSTNWCTNNTFTTNKVKAPVTLVAGAAQTFTASEGSIIAGSLAFEVTLAGGTAIVFDDGEGKLVSVVGVTDAANPGTVDYATGAVTLTLAAGIVPTGVVAQYRYEFDDSYGTSRTKPAQAVLEWVTRQVKAEPYRIRTVYNMDDFFQVKQVLNNYNIDQVLSSSVAGLINKEVSGNVFDDALLKTDATYEWDSVAPAGVAWAFHRLSLLQTFVEASNGLRKQIARSGGNVVVAGTRWMNYIETLGDDLWKAQSYDKEPIGPYVAGTLANKFKIIKNQDYDDDVAVMAYKQDDLNASMIGGVFIGLYATNPVTMDDLTTIQGMGTQFGWTKAYDNSLIKLVVS
jgi:hypothetical protein